MNNEEKKPGVLKRTFDAFYEAAEEVLAAANKPFVKSKNERAFDSGIDSAEMSKIEAESRIIELMSVVKKGSVVDINSILRQRQIIKNADFTIQELKEIKKEFFS